MIIKFIKLRMRNFKKYTDTTINFGNVTKISGENAVGKTTISDAVSWILFDKLADGTRADKIRPHDANGKNIDMIDIIVELDMEVDGKPINIVKTQKQKWVKPRGKQDQEFKGNENSYIVNTIPKTEKDYKSYVAELIDEELFKFTSNATWFLKQKPQDRREKLFSLVSNMTNEDVIKTDPKFAPLTIELEKYNLDEIISRAKKSIKDNNEELEQIPARVDAVNRMRVTVDVAEMELKKNSLKEQIAELDEKLSNVTKDDTALKLGNKIMEMKFAISDYERTANEKLFNERRAAQEVLDKAERLLADALRNRMNLNGEIGRIEQLIEQDKKTIREVQTSFINKKKEEFDDSKWVFNEKDTICPNCGRPYEADKIAVIHNSFQERKQKAIDEFNLCKKNALTEIETRGKALNKKIKDNESILADKKAEFEKLVEEFGRCANDKNNALEVRNSIADKVDLSEDQEYIRLNETLANLNNQYEAAKNVEDPSKELELQKNELQKELNETQRVIDSADNSKIDEEIENYKNRMSELSQLIANAENELMLYEDFHKAKIKLLTDGINSHFNLVKWALFEDQINGGYKEICEPTVNGTFYNNGLNAGHKILAELDIVSTLQEINNVSVPVFLDNAERLSPNNFPKMDCQLISLSVSSDKNLVVESEE